MANKKKIVGAAAISSLLIVPGAVMADDFERAQPVEIEDDEGTEFYTLETSYFYGGVCDFDDEKLTPEEQRELNQLEEELENLYERLENIYEENEDRFEEMDRDFFEVFEEVEEDFFEGDLDLEEYEREIKALENELGITGLYEKIEELNEKMSSFIDKAYDCSYKYSDGFEELTEEEQLRVEEIEEELEVLYEKTWELEEELHELLGYDYWYDEEYYYEDEWDEDRYDDEEYWEDDYDYEEGYYGEDGIYVTEEDLKEFERQSRRIYIDNQEEFDQLDREYQTKLQSLEETEQKLEELEEKTGVAKLWDDFWGSFR